MEYEQTISRREFLRLAGQGVEWVARSSLAWSFYREVASLNEQGMATVTLPYATIVCLPEIHSVGVWDRLLPDKLDYHWEEASMKAGELVRFQARDIVQGINDRETAYSSATLVRALGKRRTTACLGDISWPMDKGWGLQALGMSPVAEEEKAVGRNLLETTPPLMMVLGERWQPFKAAMRTHPQVRKLLWTAAIGIALEPITAGLTVGSTVLFPQQEKRGINTLRSLLSHFHDVESLLRPEHPFVFFRNALWVIKFLEILRKEEPNSRKKLATQRYGLLHGGVKELQRFQFLAEGDQFAWWFLDLYPAEFVRKVVDHNGGIEAVSSTRMVGLAPGRGKYDWMITRDKVHVHRSLVDFFTKKLREKSVS